MYINTHQRYAQVYDTLALAYISDVNDALPRMLVILAEIIISFSEEKNEPEPRLKPNEPEPSRYSNTTRVELRL